MTQVIEQKPPEAPADNDLVVAIQAVLAASPEPLTPPKIRAALPSQFRSGNLEEVLHRQVAAQVLYQYPKYRSQQDRFWNRPMPEHVAALLQTALQEGPLAASELRRKLPSYAHPHFEAVLDEQLQKSAIHRHPRAGRTGERFGQRPADPRDYLRSELEEVFNRLEKLGFLRNRIQEGALELLHEEEWSSPQKKPVPQPEATPAAQGQPHQPSGAASQREEPFATPAATASSATPPGEPGRVE
jgi:hypothetical protein